MGHNVCYLVHQASSSHIIYCKTNGSLPYVINIYVFYLTVSMSRDNIYNSSAAAQYYLAGQLCLPNVEINYVKTITW